MILAVGLAEGRERIGVALEAEYVDDAGRTYSAGTYQFDEPITLRPMGEAAAFRLEAFTIGVGFHWERDQNCRFRGGLRVVETRNGLTAINDVDLETYVESVIGSEMSAESPGELLKAHAVISRSWLLAQLGRTNAAGTFRHVEETGERRWEIRAWYGREGHSDFDVCADDHCQRYQGISEHGAAFATRAVRETRSRGLVFAGEVCDARFYKCCGGVTEAYATAWEDRNVAYLVSVRDGEGALPRVDEGWLRGEDPAAYCCTQDPELLGRILPGFDRETTGFFRWRTESTAGEWSDLVARRSGVELGEIRSMTPVRRGASGRIFLLDITGTRGALRVGKELEIRRILSESHLYSSAFVVDRTPDGFRLSGAGWGHGVGLCQIGAAVMAARGLSANHILSHYYPGSEVEVLPSAVLDR
jgi:SpoIID/LytB domain protein